ncbi:MAG TPA: hypothetical protein VMJ34_00395 [Bryobacteraceae bacterium]|nr:hypothetical protein [Bryobacteraceae bacterium]
MPCCLLLALLLLSPRIILVFMFFTGYLGHAFHHHLLIPLLGFIFLPLTTVVYAWEVNNGRPLEGLNLVFIIIAVVIDLGAHGGGASRKWRNN